MDELNALEKRKSTNKITQSISRGNWQETNQQAKYKEKRQSTETTPTLPAGKDSTKVHSHLGCMHPCGDLGTPNCA